MFGYLEDQRQVSNEVSALRESLLLLDKRTAAEDEQIRAAIKVGTTTTHLILYNRVLFLFISFFGILQISENFSVPCL